MEGVDPKSQKIVTQFFTESKEAKFALKVFKVPKKLLTCKNQVEMFVSVGMGC